MIRLASLLIVTFIIAFSVPAATDSATLKRMPSNVLNEMGRKALNTGHHSEAILPLSIVARRYYEHPDDPICRRDAITAMHWLGVYYMDGMPDYGKSYEYTATAMAIAEEDGLNAELPNLYSNMAALLIRVPMIGGEADEHKANDYMKRAYRLAVTTNNMNAMLTSIDNMLQSQDVADFKAEIENFRTRKLPPTPAVEFTRHQVKAYQALEDGDTSVALRETLAGMELAESYDMERAWSVLFKAALLYEEKGDYQSARPLLYEALNRATSASDTTSIIYAYGYLANNYARSAMPDSARHARFQWLELREAVRGKQDTGVKASQLAHQIEQVNSDLKAMSIMRRNRERQLLWMGAILFLLGMCALWLYTRHRSQQRHIRELYAQNVRLLSSLDETRANIVPPSPRGQEKDPKAKYKGSPMDAGMIEALYLKIANALSSDPDVYDPNFSIERLAGKLNISSRYISQAVNSHGSGFPQMLNAARIEEACRRFRNVKQYGCFTVEAVAQSVGMSRSSFGAQFKKVTGLTPVQYRDQVLKSENSE